MCFGEWYAETHRVEDLHKRVVDRDDEDIAGVLQALEVDVTRDVSLRACWACEVVLLA